MADQRQPFRFRLPWLPPTATPAPPPTPGAATNRPRQPATAPTPAPQTLPPRQPATAPPRPAFRPPGVGPAQLPPRVDPPKATEQGSAPKPTSPPKTEPPSKPNASTGPPKSESPSSSVSTLTNAKTTTSPPKQPPIPPSPKSASKPPSPSRSPARSKYSSPSSSSPASPRDKAITKPHNSPKREPSLTPKYPNSPPLSKKEPQKLEAQQHATASSENASNSDEVVAPKPSPNPIQTLQDESIIEQNEEPKKKDVIEVPEPETMLQPVAESQGRSSEEVIHKKEMINTSGVGKKPAQTTSNPSNPKVGKPHHNHKPAPFQKEIKEDISKFVNKLGVGQGKQTMDGDKQLTVITLAGENRGAAMTLSNESKKKESFIHIHRGYRANPDEGIENSTDGEESSKTDEETTTKAYINSNVQGINNSLLFNGSVSTMNPGVRYVRSHNTPESSKGGRNDHEESLETRKAEVSRTHSEIHAYAPTVRRRCLRGLLMESSDSDPEKPRRHGCYYDRKDKNKSKDGNVDIL